MVCPQHNIETKPEVSSDARQLLTIVVVCCADATFGPGRREGAFGRMNFIEKFTALLAYIEYAGLNHFGTKSD